MKNSFKLFDPMRDYSSILPDIPGNYLVVLRTFSLLPQIEVLPEFHYMDYNNNHYPIIYTGISAVSIRKRDYQQHFIGNNAGKSTLRKSLGSLMGFPKIPRDKNNPDNGKTKFNENDEERLSQWMRENLLLFYSVENREQEQIENLEKKLINDYNPPLNILGNNNPINKEYRALLKRLRNRTSLNS